MIENKIQITLQDGDIIFQTYKNWKKYRKIIRYTRCFGDIEVRRTVVSPRDSACRIIYKNIQLISNAWRYSDYSLYIYDDTSDRPAYSFNRKHDAIDFYIKDTCHARNAAANELELARAEKEKEKQLLEQEFLQTAKQCFQKIVCDNKVAYNSIIDKETFNQEVIYYFQDLAIEDLEMLQSKTKDFSSCIERFILAEKEIACLEQVYNYDYFICKCPSLKLECKDEEVLKIIIDDVVAEYDFIPSIFYDKDEISDELTQKIFLKIYDISKNKLRQKITVDYIKEIFSESVSLIVDKEYFQERLKSQILYAISVNDQENIIVESIRSFINEFVQLEQEYYSFVEKFGSDRVIIELTPEKKALFQRYETGEIVLDETLNKDYELYKIVMVDYKRMAYGKNGQKNRGISQMPKVAKWFQQLLDILVKQNVISLCDDKYQFVSMDNIDIVMNTLSQLD